MKHIFVIFFIAFISCNSSINQPDIIDNSSIKADKSSVFVGEYKTSKETQRIEISPITNALTFYNVFGDSVWIRLTGPSYNPILYVHAKNVDYRDATLTARKIVGKYFSEKNSEGKTYTEEFEDKQGNIRTRVYENGLLVNYKINGVEQ
jgi:hypothetical protein